jgi:hypothetical protein
MEEGAGLGTVTGSRRPPRSASLKSRVCSRREPTPNTPREGEGAGSSLWILPPERNVPEIQIFYKSFSEPISTGLAPKRAALT